jgi:hypothetical protein
MSAFDPYHVWLGIPPSEQPPNYYRLLALALFEASPEVIENAAERQMAHVRRAAHGKHAEESQRILNEIAAAQRALLDTARKTKYDDALRAQLGAAASGYEQTMEWKPEKSGPPPAPPPPRAPSAAASATTAPPPTKWKQSPEKTAPPTAAQFALHTTAPKVAAPSAVRARAKKKFPVLLVVLLAIAAVLPVVALLAALAMTSDDAAVVASDEELDPSVRNQSTSLDRETKNRRPPRSETANESSETSSLPQPGGTASPPQVVSPVDGGSRDPFDNSPSFGRASGKPQLEQTVTVSAKTLLPRLAFFSLPGEARTPIELKAGQLVKMKIDGAWRIGPGGDQVRDASALYIAVGQSGQPALQFAQGAREVEFNVQKDGWLFMGIEDLLNFDNSGEMNVQVSVY